MKNYISHVSLSSSRHLIKDGFKVGRNKSCDLTCDDFEMSGLHFTLKEIEGGRTVNLVVSSSLVDSNNVTEVRSLISDGIRGDTRKVVRGDVIQLQNEDIIQAGKTQFRIHLAAPSLSSAPPLALESHDHVTFASASAPIPIVASRDTESIEQEENEQVQMKPSSASIKTEIEDKEEDEELEGEPVPASLEYAYEMPQSQFVEVEQMIDEIAEKVIVEEPFQEPVQEPVQEPLQEPLQAMQFDEVVETSFDEPLAGGTQVAPLDDIEEIVGITFDIENEKKKDDVANEDIDIEAEGVVTTKEEEEECAFLGNFDEIHPLPTLQVKALEETNDAEEEVVDMDRENPLPSESFIQGTKSAPVSIPNPPQTQTVIDVSASSLVTRDIALEVHAAMQRAMALSTAVPEVSSSPFQAPPSNFLLVPSSPSHFEPTHLSSSSSSASIIPTAVSTRLKRSVAKKVEAKSESHAISKTSKIEVEASSTIAPIASRPKRGIKERTVIPKSSMKESIVIPKSFLPTSNISSVKKVTEKIDTKELIVAPISSKRSSRTVIAPPASTKRSPRLAVNPLKSDIITTEKRKRGRTPVTVAVALAAFGAAGRSATRTQIEPALSLTQGDREEEEEEEGEDEEDGKRDVKKARTEIMPSTLSHRPTNITPRLCFTRLTTDEEAEVQAMATSLGYVHDDVVGVNTLLVTPVILTTPRHIASIVIGQGMVVPEWIRQSLKAGRWLPTTGFEPICSVDSLVNKNVKIKVSVSLQYRNLLNGRGLLEGKSIYIVPGTVPDGALATMVKDAGGKVLETSPTLAAAKRDTASDTLWVLASSHLHGPIVASMNKAGKSSDKAAKGENAQIEEGAKEVTKFLKAGVKVYDRLIIPASCLAMKVSPGIPHAFDLKVEPAV